MPSFITAPLADANAPALTVDADFLAAALPLAAGACPERSRGVLDFARAADFFADFFSAIIL
jgi:hypothetical protein